MRHESGKNNGDQWLYAPDSATIYALFPSNLGSEILKPTGAAECAQ
jgi:hypothetical protein